MPPDERRPDLTRPFAERYAGASARWLVRAPGRINLIGEHTDYNGFPVMPMAVERAIRIAAAPRGDRTVQLRDAQPALYEDRTFELSEEIPPYEPGDWGNYAKAAVQSLVRLARERGTSPDALSGMSCLVDGDIPPAAGLSSSTALVVASALAFCAADGIQVDRAVLAERMARAEHYVGTQGGGMDQAVCLLAEAGSALKIDFFPLSAERLRFPPDCRIVAAHSTLQAPKTGKARLAYNLRVLECGIGAQILAVALGCPPPERLADVARDRPEGGPGALVGALERAVDGLECLTPRQAAGLLRTPQEDFAGHFLLLEDGTFVSPPAEGLKVLPRCRHVLTEAERVEAAASALSAGDVAELGRLMDASHRSCAEDFGISCPELDRLVELMRGAGALGARLTGAGFGGFAIGLVRAPEVSEVREAVLEGFYVPRGLGAEGNVFVFSPGPGATVEELPGGA